MIGSARRFMPQDKTFLPVCLSMVTKPEHLLQLSWALNRTRNGSRKIRLCEFDGRKVFQTEFTE